MYLIRLAQCWRLVWVRHTLPGLVVPDNALCCLMSTQGHFTQTSTTGHDKPTAGSSLGLVSMPC